MNKKLLIPAVIVILAIIIAGISIIQINKSYDIPVLMYHNLCELESDVNSQTVTADKFESDLNWLKENGYQTVLPRELLEHMGDKEFLKKKVIITFDDGYLSNYELAYPLLLKYDMKAEIAVITAVIDTAGDIFPNFCNWDMVKEMSDSGLVEIGSHTNFLHNPKNGGMAYENEENGILRASPEEVKEDIALSSEKIEKRTGIKPTCFTYPYGKTSKATNRIVDDIFPVSFTTDTDFANIKNGITRLSRLRIQQNTDLRKILD